tara:strand:+ start:86 stop:505 length:420 start_codon:yes stop_codon:yes gene_type:complete
VNVFFDNCTSPVLARTLDGFISNFDDRAFHIGDISGMPNGRNASDLDWIRFLKSSNTHWIFISNDRRILKNSAERIALRAAGLHGFVFAQGYQKMPTHQAASNLIWRWPDIVHITELVQAPAMHEIPVSRGAKLRSLSF